MPSMMELWERSQFLAKTLRDRDVEELESIFQAQVTFHSQYLSAIENMTDKEREEFVAYMCDCIVAEAVEAKDWTPWKKWKKARWPHKQMRIEILFELVDILHFMVNALIALKFEPADLIGAFWAKNEENERRQRDGY